MRWCDRHVTGLYGSVSGLLKNALDYAEELRSNARTYLDGVAVGCISCASGWQAGGHIGCPARNRPRASRWPTPLGVALNTSTKLFDENGNCVDSTMMSQLETVGQQVVEFANWRRFALTRPAPLRNQGVENTKAQYLAPDVRNKAGSPSSSGT
jgi:hypothetical protein